MSSMDEPVTDSPQNCTSACIHSLCTRTTSGKIRDNKNGSTIPQSWILVIITINTTAGRRLVLTTLCWLLELSTGWATFDSSLSDLPFPNCRGSYTAPDHCSPPACWPSRPWFLSWALRTLGPDHSLLWGWHPSLYPWDASSIPSQLGQPNRSPDAALCPSPPWGHSPRPGPSILHIFQNSLSASFLACAPYFSPRNSLPGSQSKPFMRKCGDNSFHLDPPEASCHAGWNAACLPSLPRPCPGLPVPALTLLPHSHSA